MKGYNLWSYAPYRPFLTNVGDIYICRIAPAKSSVHFEWIGAYGECNVFVRKRDGGDFKLYTTAIGGKCDIVGLDSETDYEFYVASGEKKSRVRIARTGDSIGVTVNYLHPDDEAYAFSGRYLCSPSLVRHPDGYLLASMDLYASNHPQNLTLIFRSDDNGATWSYVSELMPCFWGKMFIHKGELYMLSCSTEYGDLLIGKSVDGGKTFTAPICLLRGSNGKNGNTGCHKNPQNIIYHNGRIYGTLEWGSWKNTEFCHAAMVMSCDENADLLDPTSWSFTEPRTFDHFVPEISDLPMNAMTIEGTPLIAPDGKLLNVMRFAKYGYVIAYEADTQDHEKMIEFSQLIKFPANFSKFMIKQDKQSGNYYSVATRVYDDNKNARNLLSLMYSKNLVDWEVVCDLFDYREQDQKYIGFQYVDFEFDGEDIIFLCRTAINGAHSYHDSNYSTFHRIKNFHNPAKISVT